MVGKTLGHYSITAKLGAGGMGEVYLARDTKLDREVALKVLPAEMASNAQRLQRFEREAKTVATLNHPNIVTIFSVEEADGVRFLTMERVVGQSLDIRITAGGMTFKTFVELARPLAEALAAAHEKGVVHRDLKPANIMVTEDGRVKVLDFGLAKLQEPERPEDLSAAPTGGLTREGTVVGTVPYMSPEQLQGKAVDHRSDIFSLGVIFYQMLTGKRPWIGGTSAEMISSILRDTPHPVNEINVGLPNHLGRIVRRCLNKDPNERYQTARDLLIELKELKQEIVDSERRSTNSIAVLPFANMSPDPEQEYFCEGIAEELINGLGRIKNLRVASRTSAFQYKGSKHDIREIGERLNVEKVVEGSVRKAGSQVRITVQVVNVADGYKVWSERYDRKLEDIFAIQDEIAESIVRALEVTLSPKERRAIQNVATRDVEAYDFYLRGRKYFYDFDRRSWELSRQMYERAIKLDPSYALAYAALADVFSFLFMYSGSNERERILAEEASRKALELDPDLAEAHASRGMVLSMSNKHDQAAEQFEKAITLNPRLFEAYYFYARASVAQGKYLKAAKLYEQAIDVRPEDYQVPLLVPQVYRSLGRPDDAARAFHMGVEKGLKHLELNPDDVRALYLVGGALCEIGRHDEGLKMIDRAVSIAPHDTGMLYNVACIYSKLDRTEEALDFLERSVRAGYNHLTWLENDSDFDPIRQHPRFRA
ncbi:MAG TPA: protein kinase, partial [Candidatus Polarisedimenticolia bacterium]|nr:protein kinase [Candidatus Polarisedimenticolia bacterium]